MKHLRITNTQRGCVYDGKGVRTTFFLHGCHFSCPWCCNPETRCTATQIFFDEEKCARRIKEKSSICIPCVKNGGTRPIEKCPFEYAKPASSLIPCDEILKVCLNDKSLFTTGGGGVTFSGGEPLLQSENLCELLNILKDHDIDVALETTLAIDASKLTPIIDFVDEFIIDYKLQPCMMLYDSHYKDLIRQNLKLIPKSKRFRHRLVFINEMEDVADDIVEALNRLGIKELELLKCHNLAESKYRRLNIVNKDFQASDEKIRKFKSTLQTKGVSVRILSV